MLWIKEVEMVDSLDELKSPPSVIGKHFPNFEMLDAKIASPVNKIIPNSQSKKKVRLEEQKAQKEDRFLRRRQIAFMICDNFRVTGAHDTVLDYADLFSVTLRDDNIQEFDTRWDEVLLSMSKIPSDDILEGLYKLRIRESDQLKTVLELYDMEIHQKISVPNCQKLKNHGEKEYRSKTSFTKLWRQTWENWICSRCKESIGRGIIGLDNRADIIWRVPARELLVNIWDPPECQFYKTKRVVRRETRVCFLITKLMNNKTKGWNKATSQKE